MNLDENEKQRLFDLVCDDFLSQDGENLDILKEVIESEDYINLENILKDKLKRKVDEALKDELLKELSDAELLDLLKKGNEDVKNGFENFNGENVIEYHNIGKQYAATAFTIYDRLMKKNEEPRLPTYLVINRFKSNKYTPDTIHFWNDPDAIRGLYESLEKDGYYGATKRA